jgi:thiol:disulfide interchange protein DsbD
MKKLYLLGCLVMAGLAVTAQSSKAVHWTFTSKKLSDKVYEIHMTASIDGDYHMYSQNIGVDGPIPTSFKMTPNPLLVRDGKVKEVGKLVKKKEEVWGGDVLYYERSVDFVQVVRLKGNVKTNLAGTVQFMVCNESQCLPPADVEFKVNIGG